MKSISIESVGVKTAELMADTTFRIYLFRCLAENESPLQFTYGGRQYEIESIGKDTYRVEEVG